MPRAFKPFVELFLAERRLDLGQLGVDFIIGGQQSEFLGALHENFVIDQLLQNAQAQAVGLLIGRLLGSIGGLVVVILIDFRTGDGAAINAGHDAFPALVGVAPNR